jgi:hypothetical protein
MYKILSDDNIKKENYYIPTDPANTDYQQFIQDVAEQGIGIVEGPDVVEPSYVELRATEYPSYADQFDKIYHEGVEAWKTEVQAVKDKHPKTITGGTTIGDVPDWVQTAADNWTFNKQLREYVGAVERLSHYILAEGRPELTEDIVTSTEEVWNEETEEHDTVTTTETVITQTSIGPLEPTIEVTTTDPETLEPTTETIPNPLIVSDNAERAVAQAIVDATPQEVIDSLS